MIKNSAYYELFASYTVPNPEQVGYWVDLGANSRGKVIKVYNNNTKKWVKVTDATSEDAVAPFIGNNGNWWVDNRDTGIPAAGKNPYIGEDGNWYVYDSLKTDYVNSGINVLGSVWRELNEEEVESLVDLMESDKETVKSSDIEFLKGLAPIEGNCYYFIYRDYQFLIYHEISSFEICGSLYSHEQGNPTVKFTCIVDKDLTIQHAAELQYMAPMEDGDLYLASVVQGSGGIDYQSDFELKKSGDGTKYLSDNGEYKTVASSPLVNEEYGNIVNRFLVDLPETISQEDYDKLYSFAGASENWGAYCEALNDGVGIVKILVATSDGEISCYCHARYMVSLNFYELSYKITIKSDLTVTVGGLGEGTIGASQDGMILAASYANSDDTYRRSIEFLTTGDGNKLLADNGKYVKLDDIGLENEEVALLLWDLLERDEKTLTQDEADKISSICLENDKSYYALCKVDDFSDENYFATKILTWVLSKSSRYITAYFNNHYRSYTGDFGAIVQIDLTDLSYVAQGNYSYQLAITDADTGEKYLTFVQSINGSDIVQLTLITEGDGNSFLSNDGTYKPVDLSNVVTEAPSDDIVYGRKNGEWTEVEDSPEIAISDSEPIGDETLWIDTSTNYSSIVAGDNINIDETDEGIKLSVADGKGSGLDADKLDGINSYSYEPVHDLGALLDYHQYIIALHPIGGDAAAYCCSHGKIYLNCNNGLKSYGPCTIFYNSHKIYNTSNAEGAIFRIGEFSSIAYRYPTFCTFTYESLKWVGIQIFPDAAQLNYGVKISGHWSHTPFLIDYYNSKTTEILNEEVYNSLVIEGEDVIKRDLYNFGDKILTTADINTEDLITYGVKWEVGSTNPVLTRIGNVTLHQSLPIQSKMRGCTLADDGTVNHYFNNDWTANEDGTAIVKDGSDGMVMIEVPEHYVKYEVVDGYNTIRISEVHITGYTKVDKQYISAYEATIDRTDATTPKLASVVNLSAEFRGGNNNAEWDTEEKTLLGKCATFITRSNFRTYARNRGNEGEYNWNMYDFIAHNTLYTLYLVEYANFNCQLAVNDKLTVQGYKQGGLGAGVTNLNAALWDTFNGYYPVIPCGYSDTLGNNSGEVNYTMPESYGTLTTHVARYRGIENPFGHIWANCDGVIFDIKTDDDGSNSTIYVANSEEYYGDTITDGFSNIGELPRSTGYVSSLYLGTFFPKTVGASATTGICDYFYTSNTDSYLRTCLLGGAAHNGGNAGFGCVNSYCSVGGSWTDYGSRLVYRNRTQSTAE